MTRSYLSALALAAFASTAVAQNPPVAPPTNQAPTATPTIPAKWDVSAKHGTSKDLEFDTNVGTWMSLDLSPDGSTIVFDLLGDIYTMPAAGGTATLVLTGPAYESQPRFSPDGRRIAFSSDRDGLMNLWTMDLTSGDCDVRRNAVESLGKLGDRRALDEIRSAKKKDEAETPWYKPSCLGGLAKDAEAQILARK